MSLETMNRLLKRMLIAALLIAALLYLGDYLVLRFRIWRNLQPFGTVTVQVLYAISEKGPPNANRTEYSSAGPQEQTCVNALFPHLGYAPCWYLRRHPQKQVNV
jgi:hypothetical protein